MTGGEDKQMEEEHSEESFDQLMQTIDEIRQLLKQYEFAIRHPTRCTQDEFRVDD